MNIISIRDIDNNLLSKFDCGIDVLNVFLKCYSLPNDESNIGRTYVAIDNSQIVGYITLCTAQLEFAQMPQEYRANMPRYPIPGIRIARLAIDQRFQGNGYGRELITFALKKILITSVSVGIKIVIVDSKEESKSFYEHYGFKPTKDNGQTYYMLIETVAKALLD